MNSILFEIKEGLLISLRAIKANKIRSVLTTLGIVIGVFAVVVMSNAVRGIDKSFQEGVSSLGSDNLYIDKWAWFNSEIPWWEMRNRKNLTLEDFEKFKELARLPVAVAPSMWSTENVKYEDEIAQFTNVQGTTAEYIETTNLDFESGRFFTELESNASRNVAVIGSAIADVLFEEGQGVGYEIEIENKKFKVVGILSEQGSHVMGNFNPDNQVYITIGSMFKYFMSTHRRSLTINVRAGSSLEVADVKEEAIGVMRRVRGLKFNEINDFSINQQEGLLSEINSTVGVIQIAGFIITGLSLFVGAIGIMNIMFVSVKERTKEIGIRKAIGAKKRTILSQFIAESAIICLLGGMIGLFFSVLATLMIQNTDFPISLDFDAVILAVSISLIVGVFSGFAPAYKASTLDPVDALRYE
ncbi:MAG: ABC transporter [Melioribacteraceae bacterium]|nr:MAG: ABC transporter [Melioribacteraceae bacterium]